jgi:hypothetical protein
VAANGNPVKSGLSSKAGRRQLSANPGRAIQLSSGKQNSNRSELHHQSVRLSAYCVEKLVDTGISSNIDKF